jgi:hypothetical protein
MEARAHPHDDGRLPADLRGIEVVLGVVAAKPHIAHPSLLQDIQAAGAYAEALRRAHHVRRTELQETLCPGFVEYDMGRRAEG